MGQFQGNLGKILIQAMAAMMLFLDATMAFAMELGISEGGYKKHQTYKFAQNKNLVDNGSWTKSFLCSYCFNE